MKLWPAADGTYDQGVFTRVAAALFTGVILSIAGCGSSQNDQAPVSCLVGNEAYLKALEKAPGPVLLGSTTPISDCLVPEQEAGQLASIGQEMIVASTKLNNEARRDPGGPGVGRARLSARGREQGRRSDPHRPGQTAQLIGALQ